MHGDQPASLLAYGLEVGCIGILKNSTRFSFFKEQFDEFRIAAI